jgi:Rieske 2Fe-2S family protein
MAAAGLEPVLRPLELARTLPGEAYASAAVFEWERRHVVEGSWFCVGRAADLPAPGDQRAVPVGAASVLLVRGGDGVLRGYHNVCRHRGHELLAPGATRSARGIRCPYHAWVYGLDGACRATPQFSKVGTLDEVDGDGGGGIDRADFGLLPVPVAQWHGWLLVNVSGDAPPVEQHLGPPAG